MKPGLTGDGTLSESASSRSKWNLFSIDICALSDFCMYWSRAVSAKFSGDACVSSEDASMFGI